MGTSTLNNRSTGETILDTFFNDIHSVLNGTFVGRDASGIATSGENLGSIALPWGTLNVDNINIGGSALDTSTITSVSNRVISGAERTDSSFPDFLRPDGAALEFDIKGAITPLVVSINGVAVNVSTDITKTGLTAAPASNNTAATSMTGSFKDGSLYMPEDGMDLTISAAGSEIVSKIGQVAVFKTSNNEFFKCKIQSATLLVDGYRGYYFDSAGSPVDRAALANATTLTLMKLGWIFIENNGTTIDTTYVEPSVSFSAPTSPASGDYWLDSTNQIWKRYSGTTWEIINRTLVGEFICDSSSCVGVRPIEYSKSFSDICDISLVKDSASTLKIKSDKYLINVNGKTFGSNTDSLIWNITTNLDTGSEAASTLYFAYISDKGETVLSIKKPYFRNEMCGWYHPHESHRCVGAFFNNSTSDVESVATYGEKSVVEASASSGTATTSSTSYVNVSSQKVFFIHLDKRKGMKMKLVGASSSTLGYFHASNGSSATYNFLEQQANNNTRGIDAQNSGAGMFRLSATGFDLCKIPSNTDNVKLYTEVELQHKVSSGTGVSEVKSVYLRVEEFNDGVA